MVLGRPSAGQELRVVMTPQDLAASSKDHEEFLLNLAKNAADNGLSVDIQA